MRCGCRLCGAYMTHAESAELGCVCPSCGERCKQCLGTDTVVSRDKLALFAIEYERKLKEDDVERAH